jgi:hypothetical protein
LTQTELDKAMLVLASWRLASQSDVTELLAIACVIRNAVVRGNFKTYGDAVNFYMRSYPLREHPHGNEPQLIDPQDGLLGKIDSIYDCSAPDITSSLANPKGASAFAVARRDPHFGDGRQLIGTFGGTQFYAA